MKKEFHWFQDCRDMMEYYSDMQNKFEICICNDLSKTGKAFRLNDFNYIFSTQSYYFSQDTLDKGYKLFAHFSNGDTVEVKRGKNSCTSYKISFFQNLERLLLMGEFGGDFYD